MRIPASIAALVLSCLATAPGRAAGPPADAPAPLPAAPAVATATLDHVSIAASDARALAAFLQRVFGFRELPTPFAGGGGVVWLDLGNGVALHVFGGRPAEAQPRERHLAFTVPDITAVTTVLAAEGVEWQDFDGQAGRVQTRPDGVRQMFFRDPDGHWIEVNERPR